MKKAKIVITMVNKNATLKTNGKLKATEVSDMLLSSLCIALEVLVRKNIIPVEVLREVTIDRLEKVFKYLESEGKQDEAAKEIEA